MNKLKRDNVRFLTGMCAVAACFIGLALLHRLRLHLGLEEREFYEHYPVSWYVATGLGIVFIVTLVFSVKKAYDSHPNIQLRSKPDEFLESVLADPEYKPWHKEAERLLAQRNA